MKRTDAGIALVMATGLVTLMAFLAILVVRGAQVASSSLGGGGELAAESGLSYAAARLVEGARRVPPSAANRCDDWRARGAHEGTLPAGRLDNPSYARGEPWGDDGDGVRMPGEGGGAWRDLDGDGRFSAWSGRTRGGGPFSRRFSLRIASDAGLVPVNAGELGDPLADHDGDGAANADDPEYADLLAAGGAPWASVDVPANRAIVNLLDSLGAVLGVSGTRLVNHTPAEGNWPATMRLGKIALSDLGTRIVSARPRGGYASVEDLKPVLGQADWEKVLPYLTVRGSRVPRAGGGGGSFFADLTRPPNVAADQPRLDLDEAPLAAIRAVLRIMTAGGYYHWDPLSYDASDTALYQSVAVEGGFVRVLPEEADLIADLIDRERRVRPIASWRRLAEVLGGLPAAVADDPFTAEADGEERRRLLEDLVLAGFNANFYLPDPFSRSRDTLELAREAIQAGHDTLRPRRVASGGIMAWSTAPYTSAGQRPAIGSVGFPKLYEPMDLFRPPPPDPDHPTMAPLKARPAAPFGLSGGVPLYAVESQAGGREGSRGTARGTFAAARGALHLTSQEDFEQSRPSSASPRRYAGGDILSAGDAPVVKTGVQSHPRFSLSGYRAQPLVDAYPLLTPAQRAAVLAAHAYPDLAGDLRLSVRQLPVTELAQADPPCVFALPFNEDQAPSADTLYSDTDWKDNFGDPVRRAGGAPSLLLASDQGAPFVIEEGGRFSPCGPRAFARVMPGRKADSVLYGWSPFSAPFPLTRGDYRDPDDPSKVVARGGEVRNATISFLYPSRGGEDVVPQHWNGTFVLRYHRGTGTGAGTGPGDSGGSGDAGGKGSGGAVAGGGLDGGGMPPPNEEDSDGQEGTGSAYPVYLQVECMMNDGLMITPVGATGASGSALVMPPPISAGSPQRWRHVALVIDGGTNPDDGDAQMRIHVDGVATLSVISLKMSALAAGNRPRSDEMRLEILQGPFDDLKFFDRAMTPEEVTVEAARSLVRHEPAGVYRSGLFTFDPDRFPAGGIPAGASWDAFSPAACRAGGTTPLAFAVRAYAEDGTTLLGEARFDWDGDPATAQEALFRLPRCRHVRWEATLRSATSADTPVLDEFRLLYASPGNAWSGYVVE